MVARKVKEKKVKAPKAPKTKKEKKGRKSDFASDSSIKLEDGFGVRKNKGAKSGKSSAKVPRVEAQKDVYTLLLLLSFLVFIVATVFLYLDMASYK